MSLITGNESKIFAEGVVGNVRKAQEDSHGYKLDTPNGYLFVVCDGMGGHVGGATASQIAVRSIIEHIDKEKYASPVEALDGALQFANMQILGHANAHPELQGMGTTACIVLIQGDDVWIAHVGDSRIYLYLGNEKKLHRITKDHSYVQTLVDAGEITDDEAEHHPNKNRILKALGIRPELQPTFNYENLAIHPKNGDVFLICSDGLSGMIPDRTIERVMGENLSLHDKGEELIKLAMIGETVQPGGQDNCTLEMIEIDNSNWSQSEFHSYNPKPVVKQESIQVQEKPIVISPETTTQKKDKSKVGFITKIVVAVLLIVVLCITVVWINKVRNNNALINAKEKVEKLMTDSVRVNKIYNDLKKTIPEVDTIITKQDSVNDNMLIARKNKIKTDTAVANIKKRGIEKYYTDTVDRINRELEEARKKVSSLEKNVPQKRNNRTKKIEVPETNE